MRLLIVENDRDICRLHKDIFSEYETIEVTTAHTANETIETSSGQTFDAAIISVELSYGDTKNLLDPRDLDPDQWKTGIHLAEHLVKTGVVKGEIVLTTTIPAQISTTNRDIQFSALNATVFVLPFCTFKLEACICEAFGIQTKYPKSS